MLANYIVWNPSEGIDLGFIMIRYYSLMFVIAFGLGWMIMKQIFVRENEPIEKLDSLFIYTVIGTLLGARLGHVIFYQSELFSKDPLSILLPIRTVPEFEFTGFAGLASHGAAIAIIISTYLFSKKVMKKPLLWLLDRVVITVAAGAVFVRIGNFINSEIVGTVTQSKFGIQFLQDFYSKYDAVQITKINDYRAAYEAIATDPQFAEFLAKVPAKHPAQLYESVSYIFVFILLYFLYWKTNARFKQGYLFGLFLILLWTIRFVVEFVKESQGGIEENLGYLSTGQWLSIPFIILGFYFIWKSKLVADK
ncbi:MAG: prolipoprotein diacylglyceryl transferase [Flavobacterium sp.]